MKRRVNNLNSLKLAKMELKGELELHKTKIELEYTKIKDHYVPANIDTSGGLLSIIPSLIKPLVGNFLLHKLLKSKGKFTSIIARLLTSTFFK